MSVMNWEEMVRTGRIKTAATKSKAEAWADGYQEGRGTSSNISELTGIAKEATQGIKSKAEAWADGYKNGRGDASAGGTLN